MYRILLQMASFYTHILFIFIFVRRSHSISIDMILPNQPIVEGVNATLTCTVKGSAMVAASIKWFNRTNMVPMMADEGENVISEKEDDGTFTTRSTYTFLPSKHDNQIRMRCRGKNLPMADRLEESLEASHLLDVHYVPRVVLKPNGVIVKNFSEELNLSCEFDGNPKNLSKIVWNKNGEIIKSSSGNDTVLHVEQVRHFHQGNYSCELTNSAGSGVSSTNLLVEIIHPPAVQLVLSSNMMIEQDNLNVTMECNVISANPDDVVAYKWLFKGEVLYRTTDPIYILTEIDRFDAGNYSCKARNSVGWGEESNKQQLRIKYLPSPAHLHYYPPIIVKGKAFTLTCDVHDLGNPPAAKYNWYHNNRLLEHKDSSRIIINSSNTKLPLKFSCNVANELGEGVPAQITVPLMTPPTFLQLLPPVYGVSDTDKDVSLICHVECSPQCSIFWLKNGLWIDEFNKDYTITELALPENTEMNTLASVSSTLKWNFNHWPDGKLKRKIDDANYTCEPSENLIGRGVNSTVLFQVEYAPENIALSTEDDVIDVIQGDIIKNIQCSADADPKGTYSWLFGEKCVSNNSELNFKDGLSKEMSGLYTCIVSNVHGKTQKNVSINVLYAPEDIALSTESNAIDVIEGDVIKNIKCSADANPEETYLWLFGEKQVSKNSELTFKDGLHKDMSGVYTCIASNVHGEAQKNISINVLYKPECEISTEVNTVGKVFINCEFSANPNNITIEWRFENDTLTDDIISDDMTSSVIFAETPEKYGRYECTGINMLGQSSCVTQFTSNGR